MAAAELQILDFIQQIRNGWLDHVMVWITSLGNGGMIWIITGITLLISKKHRKTGLLLLAALAVEVVLCNGILKQLVARARPCDINGNIRLLIPRPTDYSFPSGHTGASAAAAVILWYRREKGYQAAIILACMIAFSRMYLYVHYPTDILGGVVTGSISAAAVCIGLHAFGRRPGKNRKIAI